MRFKPYIAAIWFWTLIGVAALIGFYMAAVIVALSFPPQFLFQVVGLGLVFSALALIAGQAAGFFQLTARVLIGLLVLLGLVFLFTRQSAMCGVYAAFLNTAGLTHSGFLPVGCPFFWDLPAFLWSKILLIPERIWQAVIAGVVVAIGWMVNGYSNRRSAARARRERLRDTHRALFAEIRAVMDALVGVETLMAHRETVLARMDQDPKFVPFVPKEHQDQMFQAIIADVSILPRVTIDSIVTFYGQLHKIEGLAEDMRGAAFKELSQQRRLNIYRDFIEMKTRLFAYGDHATRLIAEYAQHGDAAAKALDAQLRSEKERFNSIRGDGASPNSLAADPNDQVPE